VRFCTVGPNHVGFVLVFFIGGSEKTKHGSRLVDIGGLDGTDRFTTSSFSLQLSICHCYRASLPYNNDLITRTVLGFWECEVISVTHPMRCVDLAMSYVLVIHGLVMTSKSASAG
jgi:hypothetical protein